MISGTKLGMTLRHGFTLIELLVVIAVIGILASIVLVSTSNVRNKGTNARLQGEVSQLRSAFEQNYIGSGYAALSGSVSNIDTIVATSSNIAEMTTLLCAVAKQGGYPSTVSGDITVTCDGIPNLHTGVIVFSNDTGWNIHDYGIYATTTPGGYICFDSFGNSLATTSKSIPASFAGIPSPTTALCQ